MKTKLTERAKFWLKHIEAAKAFKGTAQEYCAREEISAQSFYQWRRKFSVVKAASEPSVFIAVEFIAHPNEPWRRGREIPDPRWAAAFVSHLLQELEL